MAKSKNNAKKLSYISVPSQIINSMSSSSLQSLLVSPKKSSRSTKFFSFTTSYKSPRLFFSTLFLLGLFGMIKFGFNVDIPFSPYPCATTLPEQQHSTSNLHSKTKLGVASKVDESSENTQKDEVSNGTNMSLSQPLIANVQLQAQGSSGDDGEEEEVEKSEFWKQPDGLEYKPCLEFSRDYRRASEGIVNNRRKYLMVVVSGGMNQQRNQIVDAVVIARILGASLVVPILQVNVIWGDER